MANSLQSQTTQGIMSELQLMISSPGQPQPSLYFDENKDHGRVSSTIGQRLRTNTGISMGRSALLA